MTIQKTNQIKAQYSSILASLLNKKVAVIDVGCGAGWLTNSIGYYYKTSTLGIDYNTVALKQANQVAALLKTNSNFVAADFFNFNTSCLFDVVICLGVLHHTNNCLKGLQHLCRNYVKKNGYLFVGLYHKFGRKPFLDHFNKLKLKNSNEQLYQEYKKLHTHLVCEDDTFLKSWFHDQVLRPHETQHTLSELLPVLKSENMQLKLTSINQFKQLSKRTTFIIWKKNT